MIVELDPDGWRSQEYSKYKPYSPPSKDKSWKDYCKLNDSETGIVSCWACDTRKTGCQSSNRARYNCHKKKEKQTSLFEFKG